MNILQMLIFNGRPQPEWAGGILRVVTPNLQRSALRISVDKAIGIASLLRHHPGRLCLVKIDSWSIRISAV